MKSLQLFAISILFLASAAVMAQPVDLRLIFHLEGDEVGYTATVEDNRLVGSPTGCVTCHSREEDRVFLNDRY